GDRAGRLRGRVLAGRHEAQATAGGWSGVRIWMGTGGAAVPGISETADRRVLPPGARYARDAAGLGRKPPAAGLSRPARRPGQPGGSGGDFGVHTLASRAHGRAARVRPRSIMERSARSLRISV